MITKFMYIELTTRNKEQDTLELLKHVTPIIYLKMQHGWKWEYHSYAAHPVFCVTTEIGNLYSDYNGYNAAKSCWYLYDKMFKIRSYEIFRN